MLFGGSGKNRNVRAILIYSSSVTVLRSVRVCLGTRKFGILGTRDNSRTLGVVTRGRVRYLILSVVVPNASNLRAALGVERRGGGFPVVVLSTGSRSASGVTNLNFNTSSCIAGPFGPLRLITEIGSRVHECISFSNFIRGTRRVIANNLIISARTGAIDISNRSIQLATERCVVLRCLYGGVNHILSSTRVCRTI